MGAEDGGVGTIPTVEIRPWRNGDEPRWIDATSITMRCSHGYVQRLISSECIAASAIDVINMAIAAGIIEHDQLFAERCFAEIQQRYVRGRALAAGVRE